jgi:hypothetical protein
MLEISIIITAYFCTHISRLPANFMRADPSSKEYIGRAGTYSSYSREIRNLLFTLSGFPHPALIYAVNRNPASRRKSESGNTWRDSPRGDLIVCCAFTEKTRFNHQTTHRDTIGNKCWIQGVCARTSLGADNDIILPLFRHPVAGFFAKLKIKVNSVTRTACTRFVDAACRSPGRVKL